MQGFDGGAAEWNAIVARMPMPHLLQTWQWAQVKAAYGWKPMPLTWTKQSSSGETCVAAAMVLKRQILRRAFTAPVSLLYVPKGPLLDWTDENLRDHVLGDLQALAKREHAIFLKLDPDVVLGTGVPGEIGSTETETGAEIRDQLKRRGWVFASDQIQFRNTVLIDLAQPEGELLRRMGQKMRYNVRLAEKKGVTVRSGRAEDLPLLYRMYAETSARDGFVIREEGYYQRVWSAFMDAEADGLEPAAAALIAEVQEQPVAALFLFHFAQRAYYLYGMSRQAHREKMPNHLLQWEAIRRAKGGGCRVYDLWGAPDAFKAHDPMWGVFRFKQGLGGEVVRTLGAWDYPASGFWYRMYTGVVPRVLHLMRMRGREQTRRNLAAT